MRPKPTASFGYVTDMSGNSKDTTYNSKQDKQ